MGLPGSLSGGQGQWSANGITRFRKGGQRELSYFKARARKSKVEFEDFLVQPGANPDTATVPILALPRHGSGTLAQPRGDRATASV